MYSEEKPYDGGDPLIHLMSQSLDLLWPWLPLEGGALHYMVTVLFS